MGDSDASVLGIFGPTGSGKTEVAVELARELGTEVVNADPAQCYIGFPILTNQPTAEHDAIAAHRMVAVWPPNYESSAAAFARQVHDVVDELVAESGTVVVVGGSGMYLRSALSTLEFGGLEHEAGDAPPPARGELRAALEREYDERGGDALYAELAGADPRAAARIHPNNRQRLLRYVESVRTGGTVAPAGATIWDAPYRHPTTVVELAWDRAELAQRIEARTEAMFERGALDEVAAVVGARAQHLEQRTSVTARKLHGLQDCVAVLRGEIDADEAIERLVTRTRQYTKRQQTWARRWPGIWTVPVNGQTDARELARLLVAEREIHAIR